MNPEDLIAMYQGRLDEMTYQVEFLKRGETTIWEQSAERPERRDITARLIEETEGHIETYRSIIERMRGS